VCRGKECQEKLLRIRLSSNSSGVKREENTELLAEFVTSVIGAPTESRTKLKMHSTSLTCSTLKESPREESPREESPRKENARKESPREESPRKENARKENARKENARKESVVSKSRSFYVHRTDACLQKLLDEKRLVGIWKRNFPKDAVSNDAVSKNAVTNTQQRLVLLKQLVEDNLDTLVS